MGPEDTIKQIHETYQLRVFFRIFSAVACNPVMIRPCQLCQTRPMPVVPTPPAELAQAGNGELSKKPRCQDVRDPDQPEVKNVVTRDQTIVLRCLQIWQFAHQEFEDV